MNDYELLAEAIFPNVTETLQDLEKKYPPRNLDKTQEVLRFAPSPTGFLHTGSLCTALMDYKVALDSNGVFILRIEDTDQQREVKGSADIVSRQLREFNIPPTEGYVDENHEIGNYGPYVQSHRKHIYDIVLKHMIQNDMAYPCFCSSEELDEVRKVQTAKKERTGYYGEYATCRNLSPKQALEKVQNGEKFVLRFKSHGSHEVSLDFHDEMKGDINYTQNDMDIIIMKGDGLPTYHFAHLVDDHFMRTTIVLRGEEWLSSLPVHLEMFDTLGFERLRYAHAPVIMKVDETGKKRKLSKRHDPEASVTYFQELGYPIEALILYLYTVSNSNFEAWLLANPKGDTKDFKFSFEHTSSEGALFDLEKIKNISQNFLANASGKELATMAKTWAEKYDEKLAELINRDFDYFVKIMGIEKDKPNPRKDYEKFSEIFDKIKFFYKDYYEEIVSNGLEMDEKYSRELITSVVNNFIECNDPSLSEEEWFNKCRDHADILGFAANKKIMKAEPEKYPYLIANYMEIIRVIITGRRNAPNLYYCLNIIDKDEINHRLEAYK